MKKIFSAAIVIFLFASMMFASKAYAQEIDSTPLKGGEFAHEILSFYQETTTKIIDKTGNDVSDRIKRRYSASDINSIKNYLAKYELSIVRITPSIVNTKIDLNSRAIIAQTFIATITSVHDVVGSEDMVLYYKYSGTYSYDTVSRKITAFFPHLKLISFRGSLPVRLSDESCIASMGLNSMSLKLKISIDFDFIEMILGTEHPHRYYERKTKNYYPSAN